VLLSGFFLTFRRGDAGTRSGVLNRDPTVSGSRALIWSGVWTHWPLLSRVRFLLAWPHQHAGFVTGYVVELSLSVDTSLCLVISGISKYPMTINTRCCSGG